MDVREKLVELLAIHCDMKDKRCIGCEKGLPEAVECKNRRFGKIADHLIAHGVTVQEWISVKDRLPENDYGKHWKERKHYLVRLQNGTMRVARYGYKDYGWWVDSHDCVLEEIRYTGVTHWMPLPQPPKGE